MDYTRGTKWMQLIGGADNTNYLPGDGAGSKLVVVVSTTVVRPGQTTDFGTQCDLTSSASVVAGQTAITADGYFGTVVSVDGGTNVITVDRWRSVNTRQFRGEKRGPANGVAISFFTAGSIIAGSESNHLKRLHITRASGAATLYILDHRLATATPVFQLTVAGGTLASIDLDISLSGPFALRASVGANVDAALEFIVNG